VYGRQRTVTEAVVINAFPPRMIELKSRHLTKRAVCSKDWFSCSTDQRPAGSSEENWFIAPANKTPLSTTTRDLPLVVVPFPSSPRPPPRASSSAGHPCCNGIVLWIIASHAPHYCAPFPSGSQCSNWCFRPTYLTDVA